jgi:hypothetical protein
VRPAAGFSLLTLGLLALIAAWRPEVLVMAPWSDLRFDRPSDLSFDAEGRLEVLDQDATRLTTIEADGRAVSVVPTDRKTLGTSLAVTWNGATQDAWHAGLDGVVFEREALSGLGGRARLDPWKAVVLWERPTGAPLVLSSAQWGWDLRIWVLAWYLGGAVAALVAAGSLGRSAWRWLHRPGALALRLAALLVPLVAASGAVAWWQLKDALGADEATARQEEMLLLGMEVLPNLPPVPEVGVLEHALPATEPEYEARYYAVGSGTLVPRPQVGVFREYWAAIRTGDPQAFLHPGFPARYFSVLVPVPGGDGLAQGLLEIRWDRNRGPGLLPPPESLLWALVALTACAAAAGLLTLSVRWLRVPPRPDSQPFEDADPFRCHAPRQWAETWGPDILAPLHGGPPLRRDVLLVTWVGGTDAWADHLGHYGALEISSSGTLRRALFPLDLRLPALARARWVETGAEMPDLRMERCRVSLGFMDDGFRVTPQVMGLPRPSIPSSGTALDPWVRHRWPRAVAVANRLRSP